MSFSISPVNTCGSGLYLNIFDPIELDFVDKNFKKTINLSKSNSYNVNTNHNITQNNEKNIEKNLMNELSEDIANKILKIINEF